MKKIYSLIIVVLTMSVIVKAQNIEDARKQIYYEKYESAKNILKAITAKTGAPPEAWYWLGSLYLEQNNLDSAGIVLEAGMNYFRERDLSLKKEPLVPIGYAHLLLEQGKTAEARQQMEAVLKETKNKNATAMWAIAKANLDSDKGDSLWAMELLKQAIKRDKKNPAIYVTLGDAYRKMIDGSNAVMNYDQALAADKNYAEAIHKKGRIYKTQKNPDIYVPLFEKALEVDPLYAPSLYELYYHYYFIDVKKAATYLSSYIRNSDPSPEHAYMVADLNYVSKLYSEAIASANNILQVEGDSAQARLYKLIAYSQAALGDSTKAMKNMNTYFAKQDDTGFVAKDYAMMGYLKMTLEQDKNEAISLFTKAYEMEKEESEKLDYVVNLADLQNQLDNREAEAKWREVIYETKEPPTNLDIYKWGMALYSSKDYVKADTVFGIYQEKYPEQVHGYLWRARSNALMDTTMELGLAVPHYKALVELVAKDSINNKALLVTAYEYLGAYEANTTKDFNASLGYYQNILQLEPAHEEAIKYSGILEQWIADGKGKSGDDNTTSGTGAEEESKPGETEKTGAGETNRETSSAGQKAAPIKK